MLGYTADELDGKDPLDFTHPEDRELVGTRIDALFEDRVPRAAEYRLLLKDGIYVPYACTGALCDINGAPHMVGLTPDVTARYYLPQESIITGGWTVPEITPADGG